MKRLKWFVPVLIAMLLLPVSGSALAKGKGTNANRSTSAAAKACLKGASTVQFSNSDGSQTGKVAFKNHGQCVKFFAHNKGFKVVSATAGANTQGLLPASPKVHGNSQAAKLCPGKGGGTVSFENAGGTVVGKETFKNHGACVSFFARNRNLKIVTGA